MRSFVFSDSDEFASAFAKLGYERVHDFAGFEARLAEIGSCNPDVSEPIVFGFVFKSQEKGLNPEVEDIVAGLATLFDDWRFEHMFAISYGSKSKFNLFVLESVLLGCGASLSYMADIPDSLAQAETIAKEADSGAIRLVRRQFFSRRFVRASAKRIAQKAGIIRKAADNGGEDGFV